MAEEEGGEVTGPPNIPAWVTGDEAAVPDMKQGSRLVAGRERELPAHFPAQRVAISVGFLGRTTAHRF